MIFSKVTLYVSALLISSFCLAQDNTIGVIHHSTEVYPSYTLLAPSGTTRAYLIDVCGRVVHQWDTDMRPALRTMLSEDATLIRTGRIGGNFAGGGIGGEISAYDWDGNKLWNWTYANDSVHLHHDFDIMPNGNILAVAWESLSWEEAVEMGRDPNTISMNRGLWPDHLVEYNPSLDSIVWSWHFKDHLIQDVDSTKINYGIVEDNPQLLDINLINPSNGDWMHINSVFYNSELDQIIMSSRTMNEIFIIDHSTTTAEAASHAGGDYGMGGDILFRWGNPQNYKRGNNTDRRLYGQHDARWILNGPNKGSLMVYNNGSGRPGGFFSSIERIDLPSPDGLFFLNSNGTFEPQEAESVISGQTGNPVEFYSDRISGAQELPNGNIFVCVGLDGVYYEFDEDGNLLWEYVNPLNGAIAQEQGEPAFNSQIFKSDKYPFDFPAFHGKDLEAGLPLEINPNIDDCLLLSSLEIPQPIYQSLNVNPSPADQWIEIVVDDYMQIEIFDTSGKLQKTVDLSPGRNKITVQDLSNGIYLLRAPYILSKFVICR